jgi:Holliday junction resolvase RusA-like endonuclease
MKEMGSQVKTKTYKGDLIVRIHYKCVNRIVGDIDNITKPVLDMLQEYNIIENDKNITELHLKKTFKNKENEIEISIREKQQTGG